MSQRPTRKAGLPKARHENQSLQRSLDAIVERIEVLDGIRGDTLDQAVTFRDLNSAGFDITANPKGGSPDIGGGTGGGTDAPGVGPTNAPSNLAANETFLALLLSWDNPSTNLQHIEIWRATTDNLSLAIMIGTTVSPLYVDYVGASASFYYWVRAVATDGTYSAYNDTAGTLGTTGIDPSDFELELNISSSNLSTELGARIDLIDDPTTGLVDRVGVAEGEIVSLDSRTDTLEVTSSGLVTTVDGHTTSISANASASSTNSASITQVLVDLGLAEDDILVNAGAITANASSILNLEAAVGALDPSAGITWEFDTDADGWVATNASLTPDGAGLVAFTPSASDPYMATLPTFTGVSGSINTVVVVRLREAIGGGTWEGSLYYETAGHSYNGSYLKTIPDPGLSLNEWTTLTWDMADLTVGGTDWLDSDIIGLRLDLVSDAVGKFDIDWIQIARYSSTATSEAINALDVRVTTNESGISAHSTQLTALEAVVDVDGGQTATASALSALTVDVVANEGDITTHTSQIASLQSTVDDPLAGVGVNASAITALETDVSTNEGNITAQATDITQLVARISGSYASVVNPLTTLNESFGASYSDAEVQSYNNLGGRTGVAARIDTTGNVQDYVYKANDDRLYIEPGAVYEVRFSVYHDRPTDAGSFYAGLEAYTTASSSGAQDVATINAGVTGSSNANPYWLNFKGANHDEEWLDVTCYILGVDVDPAVCPRLRINGVSDPTDGYAIHTDGYQVITAPYVRLRFLNYNGSPSYGDDTETTTYVTDLQVRRIDSEASSYAALEVQAEASISDIGDLNALYSVKVELNSGGVPYVSGFGLTADVIAGTASSAFGIRADQFFIAAPGDPADTHPPFIVGTVDGTATVGIDGALIVDGTVRASTVFADLIGADVINVVQLNAALADVGILTGGLIRTAPSGYRVELEDTAGTAFPLWYGTGSKSASNGLFYIETDGGSGHSNVVVKGLLDAGMIKQSYFAPAGSNQSFRVATQYPSSYSAGVYSGKKAHINTMQHMNFYSPTNFGESLFSGGVYYDFYSSSIGFVGPFNTSSEEFARLGSYSEMITIDIAGQIEISGNLVGPARTHRIYLQYQYNSEGWKDAYYLPFRVTTTSGGPTINHVSAYHSQVFVSRSTAFNTLSFRLHAQASSTEPAANQIGLVSAALKASTPNFGYADASVTDRTDTVLRIDQLSQIGLWR